MTTTQIRSAAGLSELVDGVRTAVAARASWADTAQLVAEQPRRHLPSPDVLTAQQRLGSPDGYRSHTLHVEPDGSFSIIALVRIRPARRHPPGPQYRRHHGDLDPQLRSGRHAHRLERPALLRLSSDALERRRTELRMGKLVVTEFVSLDGIVEDPAGEWVGQFDQGAEAGAFKLKETLDSECLLLGRVTYEGFVRSWPHEQGEFADKFNSMPKYVVSSTLQDPSWTNTTVLRGDLADQVAELTACAKGDVVVHGSATLVQALVDQGLVDEIRLMVFPTILGSGRKLFGQTGAPVRLRLVSATPLGPDGVLLLIYQR